MKFKTLLIVFSGLGLVALSLPAAADKKAEWTEIQVPPTFLDSNGKQRFPGCSSGPMMVDGVPQPADGEFSFFVKPGDSKRLAIFFDGGGACWDSNTCVAAPMVGAGLYSQTVNETVESLSELDGLGDAENKENPVRDYTLVYIPYCTGDLHTGAADRVYVADTPFGQLPWLIRHRGADNVAYVLDWLDQNYDELGKGKGKSKGKSKGKGKGPDKLYLSGASAGGYGVIYHTPAIAAQYPDAREVRILVDAANGVINQDFYDRALAPGGNWNVWENLSAVLVPAFASGPATLYAGSIISVGITYPDARIGQYTTAADGTQIFFFNVARNLADFSKWFDPAELAASGFIWVNKAATDMFIIAAQTPNYRLYLAAGGDHTIVGSDKTYSEDTAGGVRFIDWFKGMIKDKNLDDSDWQNVNCDPNCLP